MLIDILGDYMVKQDTNYRKANVVSLRIAVGVFYYRSGASIRSTANFFRIPRSTIESCINDLTNALNGPLKDAYLVFPTGEAAIRSAIVF